MYVPKRGDFVWLQFSPHPGQELRGRHPAFVVSQDKFNEKMGFVLVCPISSTKRRNPFYILIPEGLEITGVIMADQLRSLDYKSRKAEYIGECPEMVVRDVLRRIKPILF